MVKKQLSRREIIKVVGVVVLLTIIIFTVVAFLVTRGSYAPSASDHHDGKATVKGLAVCLPHKNTDGPQTLECAIGIRDDKGVYYSLSDSDESYSNISTVQTGKTYEVTGNLEERSDPKYQTAGIVRIESISEL